LIGLLIKIYFVERLFLGSFINKRVLVWFKMVNKKGQQMTLGTIIAIVLGIAVLVFLIFGFSTGWNNLWDKVTSFGGGANVDTIVQACALKCSTENKHGFCTESRTLKTGEDDVPVVKGSCSALSKYAGGKYGIEGCPGLDCPASETTEEK